MEKWSSMTGLRGFGCQWCMMAGGRHAVAAVRHAWREAAAAAL
ncbi:hypothetical protein V6Z11_A07G097000 [Gossypium hirsutum]